MKQLFAAILAACALWGFPLGAAASDSKGPKIVEIDESGNVTTSRGTDVGSVPSQADNQDKAKVPAPSDRNAGMSICDANYQWAPTGVSTDTIARSNAFYRDVTRKYELAQIDARKRGTSLSREREIEYWDAYKRLVDSVPLSERKVVQRGVSPRLSCDAPPVISKAP